MYSALIQYNNQLSTYQKKIDNLILIFVIIYSSIGFNELPKKMSTDTPKVPILNMRITKQKLKNSLRCLGFDEALA